MQNASSIFHGRVWDRAGLRPEVSQEAAPIPGVLFALPPKVGTVLTMGKPHVRAVCPGKGERRAFLFFFQLHVWKWS